MKPAILAALIVLSTGNRVFACTCISGSPPIPACQEIKAKRTTLFVGKVEHIGSKTVLLPPNNFPVKMQIITFQVLEAFGASKDTSLLITDWAPGNGSCGFPFVQGETYLVDSSLERDDNALHLNSCGYTTDVADAEDMLRFLRSAGLGENATLFGTVKEYVGEKNFVAKRNKPISGATLIVTGADGQRSIATDRTGWYLIRDLSPGKYAVRADVGPEYRPLQAHNVVLSSGGCAQVDLRTDRTEGERER